MHDDEFRRLKRLILWSWGLILVILVAVVILGSIRLGQLNNSITILSASEQNLKVVAGPPGAPGETIVGPQGIQGPTGQQGIQGPKGDPGQSVTPDEIAAAVTAYLEANPPASGPKGDQGLQGDPGANGREIEMRADPSTKELQWRYVGTTIWRGLGVYGG